MLGLDTKKVLDSLGYVPARESNGKFFYRCPLHHEQHGTSFCIFPDGGWKCFGKCDDGGDAIHFLAQHDKVPYSAAIQKAETIFGIKINHDNKKEKYAALYAINKKYAAIFHDELVNGQHEDLLQYLAERGIKRDVVDRWRVGFFHEDLVKQTPADYEDLVQAGLLFKKDRYMSALGFEKAGRIVFPVCDFDGDIVAFSARISPFASDEAKKSQAKYINTATTPIFEKKYTTFGYARTLYELIKDFGAIVLVEGAVDALILQENLIPAVALLGLGSNNPESVELLTKFTKKIILFLDGDEAGFTRILKMAKGALFEVINRTPTIEIGVAFPPLGKDPDEYVLENRSACYETLQQSEPLEEYVFAQIVNRVKAQDTFPKKRMVLFKEFAEVLRSYPRSMRNHYLKEIEKQTDLEAYEELSKDIPQGAPTGHSGYQYPSQRQSYSNQRSQYNNQSTRLPTEPQSVSPQTNQPPPAARPRVYIQWKKYPHLLIIKANPELLSKANQALRECGFKELSATTGGANQNQTRKIEWNSIKAFFVSEYFKLLTDLGSSLEGGLANTSNMVKLSETVMKKEIPPTNEDVNEH